MPELQVTSGGGDYFNEHVGPHGLAVYATSSNSITLQWRMTEHLRQNVTKYRIHYGFQNVESAKTIEYPAEGTYELNDLKPFTTYTISVEAIIPGQPATLSNQITVRTDAAAGI